MQVLTMPSCPDFTWLCDIYFDDKPTERMDIKLEIEQDVGIEALNEGGTCVVAVITQTNSQQSRKNKHQRSLL